jgi:preprotein translocase subunit SecA
VQIVDPTAMSAEDRRRRERIQRQQVALHRAAPAMVGAVAGGGTATGTSGLPGGSSAAVPAATPGNAPFAAPDTFVRENDKVGRNDPCPCGSGKKYKKCHGA